MSGLQQQTFTSSYNSDDYICAFIEHRRICPAGKYPLPRSADVRIWKSQSIQLPSDKELFSLIGGLNGKKAIVTPRGAPKDIALGTDRYFRPSIVRTTDARGKPLKLTQVRYAPSDFHTPGWLTPDEYESIMLLHRLQRGFANADTENPYFNALARMRKLEGQKKTVRFVFWFTTFSPL